MKLQFIIPIALGVATLTAGVGVVAYETNQCQSAVSMAHQSLDDFATSNQNVKTKGDQVISGFNNLLNDPFGALGNATDAVEAKDQFMKIKTETEEDIKTAQGVCSPYYPTEKFASVVYPTGFDVSDLTNRYDSIIDDHNEWASKFRSSF